ncbi:protein serine threonine kinase [Blomia tropicalis]|nr:protein serine threonine kinase [Blomia tropicalis]
MNRSKGKSTKKGKSTSSNASNNSGQQKTITTPDVLKEEGYKLHELLGEGSYSKTIKWVDRCLKREMKLSLTVRHRAIVEAYTAVKVGNEAFLVLQYAPKGSVRDYLRHKLDPNEFLSERKVRSWSSDLFSGVAYLHGHDIAHRDIKTDNFLLTQQMKPLLADFSFACMSDKPDSRFECMVDTVCGTTLYMAPEVHALKSGNKYDAKLADVYALGISLYEMLVKVVPFRGNYSLSDPELIRRQIALDYTYPDGIRITEPCRQLIRQLVEPNPRNRPTVNRALLDPWFTEVVSISSRKSAQSKRSGASFDSTSSMIEFRKQAASAGRKSFGSVASKGSKSSNSYNTVKSSIPQDQKKKANKMVQKVISSTVSSVVEEPDSEID